MIKLPTRIFATGSQFVALVILIFGCKPETVQSPPATALYQFDAQAKTRWSSPENIDGHGGEGGRENNGAKGHAFDPIPADSTKVLLNVTGAGMITRMWITVADRSPEMLRALKLEMFWDGSAKPAVSVPFGDFFGVGLGRTASFHNALFANPEGRSFLCFIPMPFRTGARVQVTNESGKDLSHIFFDIDFELNTQWNASNLYFHSYWSRDTATTLARDFELLPAVAGTGRFLGVNVGVNANPAYKDSWWGEGEVKIFLDKDQEYPTLAGTGTEDYIGTGWGQGLYFNDYSGCLVADDKKFQWAFYRLHIPDAVYFESACRVTLQQIGGKPKKEVLALQKANIPLIPVTIDTGGKLVLLYEPGKNTSLDDPSLPEGWTNYYRSDDVSATAYFYLDTPANNLSPIQNVSIRTHQLKSK